MKPLLGLFLLALCTFGQKYPTILDSIPMELLASLVVGLTPILKKSPLAIPSAEGRLETLPFTEGSLETPEQWNMMENFGFWLAGGKLDKYIELKTELVEAQLKAQETLFDLERTKLNKEIERLTLQVENLIAELNKALNQVEDLCKDTERSVIEMRDDGNEYACVITQKAYMEENQCKFEAEVRKCEHQRRVNGCFLGGTLMTMEDGSQKDIAQISRGDRLLNPILKKGFTVTDIFVGPEKDPLVELAVKSPLYVTQKHPMLVNGEQIKRASDVISSDKLTYKGSLRYTVKRAAVKGVVEVYNIIVDGGDDWREHLVEANGVTTGDMYLQRILEG